MTDLNNLKETLVNLDGDKLIPFVNQALENGDTASDILNKGLIAGMDIVGERMENQDMFIPEVLMAAKLMGQCVDILKPLLGDEESATRGCVVIGTVKGDLHDIGKNLVAMMMESAGLTVHNIGIDIEPAQFVTQIQEKKADLLCLSALLTTTMPMMRQTIDAVVESGLRDQVKIIVGGAPVTQGFADEIGADAFASDAGSAAKTAKALVD